MSKIEFKKKFFLEYWAWLGLAIAAAFIAWTVLQTVTIKWPFYLYVVQSGSMEPSIMTGDLIVVGSDSNYRQNDVVTFVDSEKRTVTHRIVEALSGGSQPRYATKGDANPATDRLEVDQSQIVGKVNLVLPKLGFLAAFGKSRNGIILIIVVPMALIIYDEFRHWRQR